MSTISGVSSGTSAAWSDLSAARASKKEIFAKVDADGSGAIDATELQGLLDKTAAKNGTAAQKADDVLAKFDTDGSGSLDKRELRAAVKSLQPPGSTHDFVQQHVAPASETLNLASTAAQPATDGDAAVDKAAAADDAAKPPSGDLKNVLADLLKAIDVNGDKKVSASEVDTFQKNVAAALQTLASSAHATSAASATASAGASSDSSSSPGASTAGSSSADASNAAQQRRHEAFSLSAFAQLVLKQYTSNASTATDAAASLSVSA